MLTVSLLVFSLCLWSSNAIYAVDLNEATQLDTWTCLRKMGYSAAIPRGYQSHGEVDPAVVDNIANAWDGGFAYVDVYASPCRSMEANTQMEALINHLSNAKYGMIWLNVEENSAAGCDWASHSGSDNCAYVQELVSTVQGFGRQVGIHSNREQWENIFGSKTSCTEFTDIPLWYANHDNDDSDDDWNKVSFGGWKQPALKQYLDGITSCSKSIGKSVDFYFYDSSDYTGGGSTPCSPAVSEGGVSVQFPSGVSLTSIRTCDSNYKDPNDAGTYVFSINATGAATQLSTDFQLSEFQSPDGADGVRVSPILVSCLQTVRSELQQPIYIGAAYTTVVANTDKVTGVPSESYHLSGTAADLYLGEESEDRLALADAIICKCRDMFVAVGSDIGLALGDTFVHVDMRDHFKSWVEAGAMLNPGKWLQYIADTYESCSNKNPGIPTTGGNGQSGSNNGCSGNGVKFPSGVCLSPVTYTDSKYNDPNDAGEALFSLSKSGGSTLLSTDFAVQDFVCKDGSDGFRLAPELVQCLQTVRDALGSPVHINSAYRTVTHNSQVGGAIYSRHMSGTAADAYSDADLWDFADAVICKCRDIFINSGQEIGLGLAGTFLHIDMRPIYSYWTFSDASITASEWNNYISAQWVSCGFSSRSQSFDFAEDPERSDIELYENDDAVITDDTDNSESNSKDTNNLNNPIIISAVVAAVFVIALIGAYFIYRRRKQLKQAEREAASNIDV